MVGYPKYLVVYEEVSLLRMTKVKECATAQEVHNFLAGLNPASRSLPLIYEIIGPPKTPQLSFVQPGDE